MAAAHLQGFEFTFHPPSGSLVKDPEVSVFKSHLKDKAEFSLMACSLTCQRLPRFARSDDSIHNQSMLPNT